MLPGKITITRPVSSEEDYISIQLECDNSHISFAEIKVSLKDFTRAITGQGFIPMKFITRGLANVGRIRESKELIFPVKGYGAKDQAEIDRWILAKLQALIAEVKEGMDRYELSQAVEPFVGFIDDLTNWYIRRCRRRFWSDEDNLDRLNELAVFSPVYNTLINGVKVDIELERK